MIPGTLIRCRNRNLLVLGAKNTAGYLMDNSKYSDFINTNICQSVLLATCTYPDCEEKILIFPYEDMEVTGSISKQEYDSILIKLALTGARLNFIEPVHENVYYMLHEYSIVVIKDKGKWNCYHAKHIIVGHKRYLLSELSDVTDDFIRSLSYPYLRASKIDADTILFEK